MISYAPLWQTMKEKKISTYHLIKYGIDKRTIHHLKNNMNITMLTAEKIAILLDCEISDIVKFENIKQPTHSV